MGNEKISFSEGNGGLPRIEIHTEHSDAEIYLLGAHVTKFQRKGEPPLLFLSEKSRFEKGHPIRGGVPIIFPWFGPREGKPAHGFARNQTWELREISHGAQSVTLKFRLPDSPEAQEFPKFTAEYVVTVGATLTMDLKVTNQSSAEFSFEDCLHTYFSVGEIGAVFVRGLAGSEYLDKVEGFARKAETNPEIRFASETDRVYLNTSSRCEIHDGEWRRVIVVEKEGSNSTVVWNPWIAKAKAMADFGDEEFRGMVCVESGNVSANKRVLGPGKTSSLKVTLSASPL